jgi:hypothetical protein
MRHSVAEALHRAASVEPAGPAGHAAGSGAPVPAPAAGASDGAGSAGLTVRLAARIDVDALGEHLVRLWRQQGGGGRAGPVVELSVVETCGRSPAERERDALRVLQAESLEHARAPGTVPLRATLVSLGTHDHLLRLAVPADAAALLGRLVAHLSQAYPLDAAAAARGAGARIDASAA